MKRKLLYIALSASMLLSSCASMLDTNPAGDSVSDEQLSDLIRKDPDMVLAPMMQGALVYMHNGYRSSNTDNRGFMLWNLGMDFQGNDMVLSATTNWFADQYMFENLRQQTAAYTADKWYDLYKIVYKSNQILDLIPEDAEGAALIYKAQAMTYRALAYYYLMCIYQDDYMHGGKDKPGVPLYLTVEGAKGRTPSTEVFAQIIADLQEAVALFEGEGYDPAEDPTDIDQTVANIILARAALTAGEYTVAANAAAAVINSGCYSLMDETEYTTSGFLDASLPETIWAYVWEMSTTLGRSSFAGFVSYTMIAEGQSNNSSGNIYPCIDERLYNQIPDSDYRKANFMAEADDEVGSPAYATLKFDTPTFNEDEIFMRLSEAYLLKAEAEARGGNDAAAQQTLYDLVSVRDSQYAKPSATGSALLDEIFLQSRIELWGEGHEWFTNKRFNVGVDRTSSANHTRRLVVPAGKDFTYQIPLSIELNSNPYINAEDQNPL